MIYGKLKEKTEDSATYQVGTTVTDMTGMLTFFRDGREPLLSKQAEQYPIRLSHIVRLYGKYKENFSDGDFPEKISFPKKIAYKIG